MCPLCGTTVRAAFFESAERTYLRCGTCALIFVPRDQHLPPLQEVLRYLEHHNDGADAGYVEFLRRLADPVCARVPVGARGLDFGCGPSPVLGDLLTASGRLTVSYDPLFLPQEEPLSERYDFVTCCEVVEHAHDPLALFTRLGALCRPAGLLAIMTQFYDVDVPFERWWYRRDATHVCFFNADTMRWIANRFGWRLELPSSNVAMFTMP